MVALAPCQPPAPQQVAVPDRQLEPTRPAPPPRPRWGLGDVAVGLVPLYLALVGLLASLGRRRHRARGRDHHRRRCCSARLLGWLFLVGVPVVATRRKGNGPVADLGLRFEVRDLPAFPLGVAIQAIVVPLLYWPILEVARQTTDDVVATRPATWSTPPAASASWCWSSSWPSAPRSPRSCSTGGWCCGRSRSGGPPPVALVASTVAVRRRPPPGPPAPGAAPVRCRGGHLAVRPAGSGRRSSATAASTRARCSCCSCSTPDPGAAPTGMARFAPPCSSPTPTPEPDLSEPAAAPALVALLHRCATAGRRRAWSSRPSCSSAACCSCSPSSGPRLLITDTTPAGGDMGAHVWGPAFLRDHLLPHGRLAGWTPDWYAGFPAYQFYMVVPALAIVALDAGLERLGGARPAGRVARRSLWRVAHPSPTARCAGGRCVGRLLVAVLRHRPALRRRLQAGDGLGARRPAGVLPTSPAAWPTCRSRARRCSPLGAWCSSSTASRSRTAAPATSSAATSPRPWPGSSRFSHQPRLHGAVPRASCCAACAGAATGPPAPCCSASPRCATSSRPSTPSSLTVARRAGLGARSPGEAPVVPADRLAGLAVTAFWTCPFVLRRAYLNDMGWEKLPGRDHRRARPRPPLALLVGRRLLRRAAQRPPRHPRPRRHPLDPGPGRRGPRWCRSSCASASACSSAWLRSWPRSAFVLAPQGRLWNARILPLFLLCICLLAAMALGELVRAIGILASATATGRVGTGSALGTRRRRGRRPGSTSACPSACCPAPSRTADGWRALAVLRDLQPTTANHAAGWARWNSPAYERKAAYPEYHGLVDDDGRGRPTTRARLRAGHVGVRERAARQLRHADGADAPAVLDRRLHRLDGGPLLRGVGDDAVPLPQPAGALGRTARAPSATCPTAARSTSTSACSSSR